MAARNRTKYKFNQFFNHDKLYVERKQTHAPLVYSWCIDCPYPLDCYGLVRLILQVTSVRISNSLGLAGNWTEIFLLETIKSFAQV